MKTEIFSIDPFKIEYEKIEIAGKMLEAGELVAFPTETVYGLGADADNKEAVANIFKTKGRPMDNPLIVHVPSIALCEQYVEKISESAALLMEKFWGGPLTIIMKKSKRAIDEVTAGLDTVAIRLPSHPVAHALIKASGTGIAAPSANISGRPSPTNEKHVIEDFNGKIPCIIGSGMTKYGLESTVIDLSGERPLILRPGAISLNMIREYLPDVAYGGGGENVPKSPGMKYKHYAPKAKVIVVKGDIGNEISKYDGKVAVIDYEDKASYYNKDLFLPAGTDDNTYGARLFYLLRHADELDADVILAKHPKGGEDLTDALCNRLYKAAGGNII